MLNSIMLGLTRKTIKLMCKVIDILSVYEIVNYLLIFDYLIFVT